jgi:FkbM family methyltransferase
VKLTRLIPPIVRRLLKRSPRARLIAAYIRRDESLLAWGHLLRPGMTVLDVGAFVGDYTFIASHAIGPDRHVYAIEPFPPSYKKLQASVRGLKHSNVTTLNFAASDKTAYLTMNIDEHHISNSLHGSGASSVEVKASTIDDLVPTKDIDLMKIDVEGHELQALMGMDQLFADNPGVTLFIEFNPSALVAAGTDPAALIDFFHERGFNCYYPIERHPSRIRRFDNCAELMRALPATGATNIVVSHEVPVGLAESTGVRAIEA